MSKINLIILFVSLIGTKGISQLNVCVDDQNTLEDIFSTYYTGSSDYTDVDYIEFDIPCVNANANPSLRFDGTVNYNLLYDSYFPVYVNCGQWGAGTNPFAPIGIHKFTIRYFKNPTFGQDIELYSIAVYIQGNGHLKINLPAEVCPLEEYNLNNLISPSGGTTTTTLGTINGSILSVYDQSTSIGPQNVVYEVITANCIVNKTFVVDIKSKPDFNWAINPLQTGQILTSDIPIDLTGVATSTDATSIYYESLGTPTGQGNSFDPSLSGDGQHTFTAVAEKMHSSIATCVDTLIQNITVTYDPGTPPLPSFNSFTSGYADGIFPVLSAVLWVCDGQEISFGGGGNLPAGIDSVDVQYTSNGNNIHVGTFLKGTMQTFTIPQTYAKRTDYLRIRGKSNLGVYGAYHSASVFVSKPSSALNYLLDTTCVLNQFGFGVVYSTDGMFHSSLPVDSWTDYYPEETFSYQIQDINTNILFDNNVQQSYWHTVQNTKVDTLIFSETSILPYNSLQLNYINNPQYCSRTDTIIVVREPTVSYAHSGNDTINAGTLVQFTSNNALHDYTEWNFSFSNFTYTGDTMYQYLNHIGNYDITCTAFDDYGCYSDTTGHSSFYVLDWTSISENNKVVVSSYPNPVDDVINIILNENTSENGVINIYNVTGALITSDEISLYEDHIQYYGLSELTTGIYILNLLTDHGDYSVRIVKK